MNELRKRSGPIPMKQKLRAIADAQEAAVKKLRERKSKIQGELDDVTAKLVDAEAELEQARAAIGARASEPEQLPVDEAAQ